MISRTSLFALAKALEGMPVLGTLRGTPAARAGIRYGDILLSVNGMRVRNVADYVEAKALDDDGMEIVVFRTGTEQVERLTYDKRTGHADPAAILAELMSLRIASDELDVDARDSRSKPPTPVQ